MKKQLSPKYIFNKYASAYEAKYMDTGLYHQSLDLFLSHLKSKDARILEVGCGPGNLCKYLLSRSSNLDILGIDIAENMITLARKNNPEAEFRTMDCRDLHLLDLRFDGIICGFCVPYLKREEVRKLIGDISSLLKSEGVLYLSTMEAFEDRLGIAHSHCAEESLEISYYRFEFLEDLLERGNFNIVSKARIENPANPKHVKDLIVLAVK